MNSSTYNLKPLSFAIILGLTACGSSGGGGSGSGSGGGGGSNTTGSASGIFVDAEVAGLGYTTDSGVSGSTDANGAYSYNPGDTISFSVGGVNLGSVAGAPKCTPFDFGAASINIAQFIQSLDADGDPSNGIDINAAATALAGTTITSDAFLADNATFAANPEITAALTTTGDTLIDVATATQNLNDGTDSTFDAAELDSKIFVVIDPTENDIGIFSFDDVVTAEVSSVFASDTTAAGSDGIGTDETWVVGGDGVLTLTDVLDGTVTTVNRIGGSSNSISVNFSEAGAAALPATLLIPEDITAVSLGGDGTITLSKTYDVIDSDGTPLTITFNSDGTYAVPADGETGAYDVGVIAENTITLVNDAFPTEKTFVLIIDGDSTVVGETTSILILGSEVIGGPPADPDLQFNDIGVGSLTLK